MTAPKAPAVPGMPAFHQLADIDPMIEGTDFAALVADILTHGLHEPIVLYQGKILDGRNRARACAEAGVEPHYTEMMFGSDAEAVAFVDSINLHRRHLTPEQKNERIAARLKADPALSDRQVAKQTRTSHPRVARVRRKLEKSGDVERRSTSTDTKGRSQPRRRSKPAKPVGAASLPVEFPVAVTNDITASPAANPTLMDGAAPEPATETPTKAIDAERAMAGEEVTARPAKAAEPEVKPAVVTIPAKTAETIFIGIAELARGCRGLLAHREQNGDEIRKKLSQIIKLADPNSKGHTRANSAAKSNVKLDQKLFLRAMALDGGNETPVPITGNDVDTEQSAEERRQVNEALASNDDLPIPECLRRNKEIAS